MRATWRDPDDTSPSARRTAREIRGMRTFCPLRRMTRHENSAITAEHIMAADKLRELVDVAAYGYSTERPLIYVERTLGPRVGINLATLEQVRAMRALVRVVTLFSHDQLLLIQAVVLRNQTLRAWAAAREAVERRAGVALIHFSWRQALEKRKLLAILERLVEHFQSELEDEVARGRRLLP